MRRSPLTSSHQRLGADLAERDGCLLPQRFTDPDRERRAALTAVALADRSGVGRLRAAGADVTDLLERLTTNRVHPLAPGQGVATVLTTAKGRILDVLTVAALEDDYLILTGPGREQAVARWIDDYTFREDARVEDVTRKTALIGVVGPGASRLLRNLSGTSVAGLAPGHCLTATIAGTEVVVVRTDAAGVKGYDLLADRARARAVWSALLRRGRRYGLEPLGWEAWESLRVAHGVGEAGREHTEAYNPLEAGLLDLISFNKGCYVGQEVVARLNTYDKVQRHLVRLEVTGKRPPEAGTRLYVDGKPVGVVTSAAASDDGRSYALAYLRREHARPGAAVQAGEDGAAGEAVVGEVGRG